MIVINAIVIYFAFGVPFGVLAASHERSRFQPRDLWRVIYELTFWPFLLLRLGRPQPWTIEIESPKPNLEVRELKRRLRSEIAILNGLRDQVGSKDNSNALAEIVDHPNPSLASKCFQRTNISKLELHIAAAEDRIKLIAEQSAAGRLKFEELFVYSDAYEEFSNSLKAKHV